jgi:hypothetical protein
MQSEAFPLDTILFLCGLKRLQDKDKNTQNLLPVFKPNSNTTQKPVCYFSIIF